VAVCSWTELLTINSYLVMAAMSRVSTTWITTELEQPFWVSDPLKLSANNWAHPSPRQTGNGEVSKLSCNVSVNLSTTAKVKKFRRKDTWAYTSADHLKLPPRLKHSKITYFTMERLYPSMQLTTPLTKTIKWVKTSPSSKQYFYIRSALTQSIKEDLWQPNF